MTGTTCTFGPDSTGNAFQLTGVLQAVNRSIVRLMPWTSVIDAQHCCFSVARREQDGDGDWGQWELDISKLHNVQVLGL